MKIKKVKIQNWRSVESVDIDFNDLMIFIGQNNHGKSNILNALLYFFGELKTSELDFHRESNELFVEVNFFNLDENDKITFSKYLTSTGELTVRKTAFRSGEFEYKGYIQNPTDEWLQEGNAGAYTTRATAESLPLAEFLPPSGRITLADIKSAQEQYIAHNWESVEFKYELETNNFLGSKNVAKGIFGQVFYIPAVKDAADDYLTKSSSAFGSLYSSLIQKLSSSNQTWLDAKDSLSSTFKSFNKLDKDGEQNSNRPTELSVFESKLSSHLVEWGAEIDLEFLEPDIDEVFKSSTQIWINDGVKTDIRRKGHGLQRALIFALIKTIAEELQNERIIDTQTEVSRQSSNSMFFFLEEPELYLHPQAQRALFDSLISLTSSGAQVSFTTHSNALIDIEKYDSICIVKKATSDSGTTISQCNEDLFGDDAKKYFKLCYWINPDRSELFFAHKVILVEGQTEKTVIPFLAKKIGCFRHDYSVIDCGSKDSIPSYCLLLNNFSIPYVAVYDLDHHAGKSEPAIDMANRSSEKIESSIDHDYGFSVILDNDIEEELGISLSSRDKPFESLQIINTDSYQINEQFHNKILSMYD